MKANEAAILRLVAENGGTIGPTVRLPGSSPQQSKAPPVGRWELFITNWTPISVNKLIGCNRFKAARLKKLDAEVVAAEAFRQGIPKATSKRRVSVTMYVPNPSRAQDPDNSAKALRDALTACGLIVDDDQTWADFTEARIEKGKKATRIVLEAVTS